MAVEVVERSASNDGHVSASASDVSQCQVIVPLQSLALHSWTVHWRLALNTNMTSQTQIYTDKQMTRAVRGVVLQNNTEREAQ